MPAPRPQLIGVPQTQKYLGGIARATLYRMIDRGDLIPIKVAGRTMFDRRDLDTYIANQRQAVAG